MTTSAEDGAGRERKAGDTQILPDEQIVSPLQLASARSG